MLQGHQIWVIMLRGHQILGHCVARSVNLHHYVARSWTLGWLNHEVTQKLAFDLKMLQGHKIFAWPLRGQIFSTPPSRAPNKISTAFIWEGSTLRGSRFATKIIKFKVNSSSGFGWFRLEISVLNFFYQFLWCKLHIFARNDRNRVSSSVNDRVIQN